MVLELPLRVQQLRMKDILGKPRLVGRLRYLTLGKGGIMRKEFDEMRYINDKGCIFFVAKDDNRIIGWSMVFPTCSKTYNAYFYVERGKRRMGIGTLLYRAASKACKDKKKKILCFPDNYNKGFFRSVDYFRSKER